MLAVNLTLFLLSAIVLVVSSSLVIKSMAKISEHFKVNEFAVGFIVIAVSTSLPELFVGISSGIAGTTDLAVGNVIGANIINLTLIIGIAAVLSRKIRIQSRVIKRDFLYMMGIILLPLLLMWDKQLSRLDGLLLVAVFAGYIFMMIRQERHFKRQVEVVTRREMPKHITIGLTSFIVLIISANFVVAFGTNISVDLGLPAILVGLLVLSLGTSLPELALNAKAVLSKHEELAIGDTLGSVITNSTLVLGVTALIHPISTDLFFFFSSAFFMVVVAFIFITFGESNRGIDWKEGLALILLYVFFLVIQTYITMLRSAGGIGGAG